MSHVAETVVIVVVGLRTARRKHADAIPIECITPNEARATSIGPIDAPMGLAVARRKLVLPLRLVAHGGRHTDKVV